jgi:hypothetical protein
LRMYYRSSAGIVVKWDDAPGITFCQVLVHWNLLWFNIFLT